jgi:hypothetical protein
MAYVGGLSGLLMTALWVFCVIDALSTPAEAMRNLPKIAWVVVVLLFPLIGSVAWLVAGRPAGSVRADLPYKGNRGSAPWPATKTAGFPEYERPRPAAGPDDDPVFLDRLRREKAASDARHEDMLRQWEADLRRREDELRHNPPADPDGGPGPSPGPGPEHGAP